MKVLSLFDGISIAQQALKELGVKDLTYYASEIDKYAINVTSKNHPDTIHLGDVSRIKADGNYWNNKPKLENIYLLIGGSPCQDLSIAKKNRKGLNGSRSGLFYEYLRILKEVKPKYFVLENVNSMPKQAKETISQELFGIQPIMINAALVSAQNRKRLFWVGKRVGDTYEQVKIELPEDKGILLRDVLEIKDFNGLYSDYNNSTVFNKSRVIGTGCGIPRSATCQQVITSPVRIAKIGKGGQGDRVYSIEGKSVNLSANGGGRGVKTGLYAVKEFVRKLTPIECERLQSLPDNYTEGVSNSQRYKALGNGFNCEVIKHILKSII